ncbi:MAG: hypothetical protein N2038_07265 [Geminicoccaceae bacterium]|nr:hypothetical protein [Geminicoccaceae bacterium]MCS7267104.1 hypothetical protein [Geminicoccaceae bacterium]MCX7630034.1 hypothetical protein [Geminicoccaceae bacterium]MDW8124974.1 hypothetical protein [Geminicoccaceae bacterium]MDW8341724.1 hypothetical protein [Geminicoccaceae bacterium]
MKERIELPEPLGGVRPVRFARYHWCRIGRAEGQLDIGFDAAGRPVRIEYHWIRYVSRTDPKLEDVYTAELWVRRPDGDWFYIVRPGLDHFVIVPHRDLAPLLARRLDIDLDATEREA